MRWLRNFFKESQFKYPNISLTPFSVMNHLLLTNGNGFEIEDGNFIYIEKDGKKKDLIVYYNNIDVPNPVDKNRSIVINIDDYSDEDLLKVETWLYFISQEDYAPWADISDGFYKLYYFNENTNKDLIAVSIVFLQALIRYIEQYSISKIEQPLPVESEMYDRFLNSLPKLKKELERLQILKNMKSLTTEFINKEKYNRCLTALMKIGGLTWSSLETDAEDVGYYKHALKRIQEIVKEILSE